VTERKRVSPVIGAVLLSFGVIFVAELGDKSQLMALAFATRYRALPVLVGITIATAVVHLVSVLIGAGLGATLPTDWISMAAGIAFFGFAAWTLRGDELSIDEAGKANRSVRSAIVAASAAFFLAELGDKTMLATITLATTEGLAGVWIGSTIGMVAADALAIMVGQQLAKRVSAKVIRYAAASSFVVFGIVLVAEGIRGLG
jgi:putative Ca2+/H+ antiporter (TMEM165/GDT1 family)